MVIRLSENLEYVNDHEHEDERLSRTAIVSCISLTVGKLTCGSSPDTVQFNERPSQLDKPKTIMEPHTGTAASQDPPRFPSWGNPNYGENFQRRPRPDQQEIPDRTSSKNPWINGILVWSFTRDGQLCVRCGVTGHSARLYEISPTAVIGAGIPQNDCVRRRPAS